MTPLSSTAHSGGPCVAFQQFLSGVFLAGARRSPGRVLLLLSQAVLFQAAYGLPAHRLNGRIQRLSAQIDHLTFDPQTGSVSRALEAAQRIAGHAAAGLQSSMTAAARRCSWHGEDSVLNARKEKARPCEQAPWRRMSMVSGVIVINVFGGLRGRRARKRKIQRGRDGEP